jgi:hypothetical protein
MYAREPFAGAPGSSGEIGLTLPSGSLLLCSFCSAVNSHRSTAAAARSRHQSTLARDQTYAPLRYIARAHPSIPQGKSSTGILAPAAYNESPIVAFQLAAAKSPLTCFTDPLPEEGSRSAPIANRLWAPRAGPMGSNPLPSSGESRANVLLAPHRWCTTASARSPSFWITSLKLKQNSVPLNL